MRCSGREGNSPFVPSPPPSRKGEGDLRDVGFWKREERERDGKEQERGRGKREHDMTTAITSAGNLILPSLSVIFRGSGGG